MGAARSIIGQCPDCCDCPAPVLRWDSRSASKAKFGWVEFEPYQSTPAKYYLRRVDSGTFGGENGAGQSFDLTFESVWERDSAGVIVLVSRTSSVGDCRTFGINPGDGESGTCGIAQDVVFRSDRVCEATGNSAIASTRTSGSGTSVTVTACYPATGSGTATLSVEYDAALLLTNALAAMPDWDGDWNDTPGSYRNLSENEFTLAIRDSRYEWRIPRHKVGSGRCYAIRWKERFTPTGGGDPIDTPRCAVWDYEATPDYDPADVTTWPVMKNGELDYWELPPPTANGTTLIVDIEHFCRCKEAVAACA